MTLELFSTSVPAGLEPGRSGFCTVAMTRGLSRPLVEALEALSAYRPVFLPTDPRAADNPVAVSYLRVPAAGRTYHVVSRIGPAGLDYTGRSNRFAHHVVLDAGDPRPAGGPAWLASRPGFLEAAFDGEIRHLPAGRSVPSGAAASAACPTWQRLTGDAGWAGVVAEALANPAARSFFLVYDLGADVLALIREAVGLLPPERRWEATFTTYFTGLPAGVGCAVRGVLRGSAEAASAQGSSLDLGKLAGKRPPANEWAAAARAGKAVASRPVAVNAPARPASPSAPARPQQPAPLPFADIHEPNAFGFDDAPRLERERKPGGVGKWVVLTVLASLVFLGGGAGAVVMLRPDLFRRPHQAAEKGGDETEKGTPGEVQGGTEKPRPPGKFAPVEATMTADRPVAGAPATLRVSLDYPKDAPPFPVSELRFALDGKGVSSKVRGNSEFEVTFPKPGLQKIVAEFAGDERFEKVSIPLEVRVLAPLPRFTLEATPAEATRGDKIEVRVKGLPADFTGFGKIGLIGPAGRLKAAPSPDGKTLTVAGGLTVGKNRIRATFPGDETFAAGSSDPAEVRVRRGPEFAFTPMSRDDFSRGKIGLNVSVRGSDKGDPVPKGTLQLLSKDEKLAEGSTNDKGAVELGKEELAAGTYELKLRFTPDDKENWASAERPLGGAWRVVPVVRVAVDLAEKETREDLVRFHSATGSAPVRNLPPNKRFYPRFRPGKQPIKGAFEPHVELGDRGHSALLLRWKPEKDSWGMAKPINDAPPFPVITIGVADTADKEKGKPFPEDEVKYALIPIFPPPQSRDFEAYRPLVPAFRQVAESLHGSEIELYDGFDARFRARPKVPPKTVRVPAAWVSADLAANAFGNHSGVLNAAVIAACASHLSPPPAPDALPLFRLRLIRK